MPLSLRLAKLLRRVRPAPLAALLQHLFGLNRRGVLNVDGLCFSVAPGTRLGSSLLDPSQEYERSMKLVLEKYLRPGAVFVDLGANEGYFTVIASRLVGPQGAVIAVEPQTRLQPVLRQNLSLNRAANVRIVQAVLCDRTGTADIYLTAEVSTGGTSLYRPTRYPLPTETVASLTLGDFLDIHGLDRVDLMKVDVEGAEFDIFMPAGEALHSGRIRNLALEMHSSILERRGLSPEALHNFLLECGYRVNRELGNSVYEYCGSQGGTALGDKLAP